MTLGILLVALFAFPGEHPARAQAPNLAHPADSIERWLRERPFRIVDRSGSRFEGDRTQRVELAFDDGPTLRVKWAAAAPGADAFNNRPRYEIAAYEVQKLFLAPDRYVVPPTVLRAVAVDRHAGELGARVPATFRGASSVLVVLQYWLRDVTNRDPFQPDRLAWDTAYARELGRLNILTYLIRHADSNLGNVLISTDPRKPRLFVVDNGIAFGSEAGDRGDAWRRLRVQRLPQEAVDRLRSVGREELTARLGVLAQFEVRGGELVRTEPEDNLAPGRGVRRRADAIQLGLTRGEIADLHGRLNSLLRRVDDGRIELF